MAAWQRAHNIDDLRQAAKDYLPRLVFDYIDGGVDDETALDRNRNAFSQIRLLPKYLVDVSTLRATTSLFGQAYDMPIGIAPTGLAGFARHGADLMLARAAARYNVPFVLSGAGTASIEDAARMAPQHTWFQLYVSREWRITSDLIQRTHRAGIQHLVVTVDVPIHSNRERDVRNGFVPPVKPTLSAVLNMLGHPVWLWRSAKKGLPRFESWAPYAEPGASAKAVADLFTSQIPFTQTWDDMARIRERWPGKLIIKGVLHPDDATRAVQVGADAIWLSNHGGRVLDTAPSALEILPMVRQRVGQAVPLVLDGGIRRASDALKALALGANFVFVGRPTLYGVAAGAQAGAEHALGILQRELHQTMAQLGGWGEKMELTELR